MNDDLFKKRLELIWPYPRDVVLSGSFPAPAGLSMEGDFPEWFAADMAFLVNKNGEGLRAEFRSGASDLPAEGYRITVSRDGILIESADQRGRAHAMQTLVQLMNAFRGLEAWPEVRIEDAPVFRRRAFMVDLGRSIWSVEMLRRLIRILRRLKLNALHFHLIDDELCGLRFDRLPFGRENPHALSKAELKEVVDYATAEGVDTIIEIETWGHVGSLVHHLPELRGGEGVFGGASFLIGEKTFAVVGQMMEEIAEILPPAGMLHLGLDEARWYLSPEMPPDFQPVDMITRYETMARTILEEAGKGGVKIIAYADHHGRKIQPDSQVILQPWNYWIKDKADIDQKLAEYAKLPAGRTWFPMAGQSMAHHRGAYAATRYWCKGCALLDNVEGIDLAFWGRNDLADRFITLFAGAQFVWNPNPASTLGGIEDAEHFDALLHPILQFQQTVFPDLNLHAWRTHALEVVYRGFSMGGPRDGEPAAPTALTAGTDMNQAFHLELAKKAEGA